MQTINEYVENCIGYRTSRYMSEIEHACPHPDNLKENEARMQRIIDGFFSEYQPQPLVLSRDQYTGSFSLVSHKYGLDTTLNPLSYFQIDRSRSIEQVLDKLTPDSEVAELLITIIKSVEPFEMSRITRTLFVALYLFCNHAKDLDTIIRRYPELSTHRELLSRLFHLVASEDLITYNQATTLSQIAKIQERPFTDEDLIIAEILVQNTNLVDILMAFHQSLYEYSIRTIQTEPKWLELQLNRPLNEVFAFSQNGEICANPKLLKVFANNLIPSIASCYSLEEELVLSKEKLLEAIGKMKSSGLFQTMIFNFTENEGKVNLNGVVPSICPAKTFLPDALESFISTF